MHAGTLAAGEAVQVKVSELSAAKAVHRASRAACSSSRCRRWFDEDGMYLTAVGDAFVPRAAGDNGATLDYICQGTKERHDYVDDDRSNCHAGVNRAGPGRAAYTCAGSEVEFESR
jgi:hypothetical protein